MSSRPDNVACFAVRPALSQRTSVDAMTTCELTDNQWALSKFSNFKAFVGSLVVQEPKLEEWSLWLDRVPLGVFLASGDGELKGVRGAADEDKRAAEAALVLERFACDWDFDLERIFGADRLKLARYIELFAVA